MLSIITHTINNNIDNKKLYEKNIIDSICTYNDNNNYFIALQNPNRNIKLDDIINLIPPTFDNFADIYNKDHNLVILYNTKYNKLLFYEEIIINNDYIQLICFKDNIIFINILFDKKYTQCLKKIFEILDNLSKKIILNNYRLIITGNFTSNIYNKLNIIIEKLYNIKNKSKNKYDNIFDNYNNIIDYIKFNEIFYYAKLN